MNIKTLALKLAGGLLAAGILATTLTGATHAGLKQIDCAVDPCPDLTVSDLTTYKTKGSGLFVSFEVTNTGKATAGASKTGIALNGYTAYVVSHPALAPGASASYHNFFAIPIGPGGIPSTVVVSVTADAGGDVLESDETNNALTKTVAL